VASTSEVFSMGYFNQPTWMPAANIPSPPKWFLGLFADFATSLSKVGSTWVDAMPSRSVLFQMWQAAHRQPGFHVV